MTSASLSGHAFGDDPTVNRLEETPAEFTSTEVVYGVTGTEVTELPEYGVSP